MKHIGVILVGGKGKRLGQITKKIPKPLVKINNLPFLDILIYNISQQNFKKIYLICSYKHDHFFKRYHKKKFFGTDIICIKEKKAKDTGGAIYEVKKKINSKYFFLFNGDTFFNIDLNNFYKFFSKSKKLISLSMVKNKNYKSNRKLSSLRLFKNNIVLSSKKTNTMNGGIYIISKKVLKDITNEKLSFENFYLPKFIKNNLVSGKIFNNYFIDIGIKKNLNFAIKTLHKQELFKCAFFDRDGVINYDNGHTYRTKDLKIYHNIPKIINFLNKQKYLVIVVTNQSGIGRGLYSLEQFNKFNNLIKIKLSARNAIIDDIFYCPHHPKFAKPIFRKICNCRKPKNGMLLDAIKKWGINKKKSIMIGDKFTDHIAAKKTKIRFFYFSKNLYKQIKKI